MPDGCGCGKGDDRKEILTRREFIKTSGFIAASAGLAATPISRGLVQRIFWSGPQGSPPESLSSALSIASTDAMVLEALALGVHECGGFRRYEIHQQEWL